MRANSFYFLSLQWRYSPFWALASSSLCLQASLSFAILFQLSICSSDLESSLTSSSHLLLGLPTGRRLSILPLNTRLGALLLFILTRISILSFPNFEGKAVLHTSTNCSKNSLNVMALWVLHFLSSCFFFSVESLNATTSKFFNHSSVSWILMISWISFLIYFF